MKRIFIALFSFIWTMSAWAYPVLSDKAQISLLTYAKTNEVHAMYGHTALRVNDPENKFDIIFNYGTFDFRSDDFVYRFAKGYTDYILSVSSFEYLPMESSMRNMSVREQIFGLYPKEKQQIFDFLMKNAEPQNRVYRYNFLFDNCATRPRWVIEKNIIGKVVYKDSIPTKTFRELIYGCTQTHRWLAFGIDLVLGSPLDNKSTYEEQMFLPSYMEDAFNRAVIVDSLGAERKLVVSDKELLSALPMADETITFWLSPEFIGTLLMVSVFVLSFLGFKKGDYQKWIDFVLFFIFGLAGSMVFFISFFSSHPAAYPNFVLFAMHPLHLIFAFLCLIPALKRKVGWYHLTNVAVLALFLILVWFLPQQFPKAFLVLTLTLFIRSLFQTLTFVSKK